MHIRFESIRLKRFRSFLEETYFTFDEQGFGLAFLKGKNKTDPLGSNGAGKSSIVDALMWCLYGKTVKGLRNPDVVPWTGKGTTEVEVFLTVDGKERTVKRTANPNLATIDGKEAGQQYIDELVAIPFEAIPYTIVVGQKQELFFDLKPSVKLEVLSNAINLDRWEARSAHASELCRNLGNEISQKELEKEILVGQLEKTEAMIVHLTTKKDEWEASRTSALEDNTKAIFKLKNQIASVQNEHDAADLKLDWAETELRAIQPSIVEIQRKRTESMAACRASETLCNQIKLNQQSLERKIATVEDEGICPTCQQPLKSHKKALQKDFASEATEIAENYKAAVRASKADGERYDELTLAINAQLDAQEKFQTAANEARDVLDRLLPQIADWQAQIKAIEGAKEKFENEDNPYKEQLQGLRRTKQQFNADIDKCEQAIQSKTVYLERVKPWVKHFKDIKLYTLEELLQELEITTNGMLDEFGLLGWEVLYDVERETKSKTISRGLNISILSPKNNKAVKWECWSGGEGQRLKLIGTAALSTVLLNHLGLTTNLEIYDEPTESLSKEGVEDLVDLLAYRAKEAKKNIWLIDHHAIESAKFKSVVEVTKDKRGSFLSN